MITGKLYDCRCGRQRSGRPCHRGVRGPSEDYRSPWFDSRAFGGQAGASAALKLSGISHRHFRPGARRPRLNQAQKFGAEMLIPVSIRSLDCSQRDGAFALATDCGKLLRARSIVVASGAR